MAVRTVHESTAPESQILGIPAAAAHCRLSTSEIRRRVRAGAFPGAFKDDHGHWRIPLGDIEAAVSGVFGANRTSADLTALEIGLRSKPDPKPRRIFSGGPSSGWGSKLTELQRLARERDERA